MDSANCGSKVAFGNGLWRMRKYCFNLQLVESADAKPEGGNLRSEGPSAFTEKHPPVNGPEQVKSVLFKGQLSNQDPHSAVRCEWRREKTAQSQPAPSPPE